MESQKIRAKTSVQYSWQRIILQVLKYLCLTSTFGCFDASCRDEISLDL